MKKAHEHMSIKCVGHLTTMLTPDRAKYTVAQVVKMIRTRGIEFDTIACRGLSATLIAPIVAMRLGKTLLCVRKSTSDCHSGSMVEGDHGARRYLIIDDFIDSGDTVREIAKEIYEVAPKMRCAGFIAYKRLSHKGNTFTFEAQMKCAWWDQEQKLHRFFPDGYNKAVIEEIS